MNTSTANPRAAAESAATELLLLAADLPETDLDADDRTVELLADIARLVRRLERRGPDRRRWWRVRS